MTTPLTPLTPVLSAFWDADRSWTLETYEKHGGSAPPRKAPATPASDELNPSPIHNLTPTTTY